MSDARVTVRLSDNLVGRIEAAAQLNGMSRSDYIRGILESHLGDGTNSATRAGTPALNKTSPDLVDQLADRSTRSLTRAETSVLSDSASRTGQLFDDVSHQWHPPSGGQGGNNANVGTGSRQATSRVVPATNDIVRVWCRLYRDHFGIGATVTPKMRACAKRLGAVFSAEEFAEVARTALADSWFAQRADLAIIAGNPDRYRPKPVSNQPPPDECLPSNRPWVADW